MCEFPLCVHLRESLDAAFLGGVYEGDQAIGEWGHAVACALRRHPSLGRPHGLVWHIAHANLLNMATNCPCEGLAQAILRNPESFLRTTLVLATPQPWGRNSPPVILH